MYFKTIVNGRFSAVGSSDSESILVQGDKDIYSEFILKYNKFKSIYVKAQFTYEGNEIGLVIGNSKFGIQGSRLIVYKDYKKVLNMECDRIYNNENMY